MAARFIAGLEPEENRELLVGLGSPDAWKYLCDVTASLWRTDRTVALDVLCGALQAKAGWLTPRFILRLDQLARKISPNNTRDFFHFKAGVQKRLATWKNDGSENYALRRIELHCSVAGAARTTGLSLAALQNLRAAWEFRFAVPRSARLVKMSDIAETAAALIRDLGEQEYLSNYVPVAKMVADSMDLATLYPREGSETCLINLFNADSILNLSRRQFGLVSSLDAAGSVLKQFEKVLNHLPADRTGGVEDFPSKIRNIAATARNMQREALFGPLLTVCDSASILGRGDIESACLDAARSCAVAHGERFRLLLWEAKKTDDVILKTQLCEELLRRSQSEEFSKHATSYQIAQLKVTVDVFSRLNRLLERQGMPMLASFWRAERNALKQRIKELRDLQHGARRATTHPWGSEEFPGVELLDDENRAVRPHVAMVKMPQQGRRFDSGAQQAAAWAFSLSTATKLENAALAISCLLEISSLSLDESGWAELKPALIAANAWWPEKRATEPHLGPDVFERTRNAPASCLLLALSLVSGYAPYLRISVLSRLAWFPDLPGEDRMKYGIEAAELAMSNHAWTDAGNALAAATTVAIATGDRAVVGRLVEQVCAIVDRISVISGPVAGVVEGLMTFKAHLSTVYSALGDAEYHREAFEVGLRMIGRVEINLIAFPERLAEFELFEKHHRDQQGPSDYFAAMRRRILEDNFQDAESQDIPKIGPPRVSIPRRSMIMQLQPGADADSPTWVLAGINDGGQDRYFSFKGPSQLLLSSWIRSVWNTLDHDDSELPAYHDAFIVPLVEGMAHPGRPEPLDGVERIIVMTDAGMPEVLLHAAKSQDGYLIERFSVAYCSANNMRSNRTRNIERSAFVGGWHPEVSGADESAAVHLKLEDLGVSAARLDSARAGRRAILDPDARVGVLHLVAHGEPLPWPNGSESRLDLSQRVSITAGEWMTKGCSASFIFANACYAGSGVRAPGHRSGFPLAFSLRGARASITALHLVYPAPAQSFAVRFYEHLAGGDTLAAYQASCIQTIRNGGTESSWVPYVHQGMPVALACS